MFPIFLVICSISKKASYQMFTQVGNRVARAEELLATRYFARAVDV